MNQSRTVLQLQPGQKHERFQAKLCQAVEVREFALFIACPALNAKDIDPVNDFKVRLVVVGRPAQSRPRYRPVQPAPGRTEHAVVACVKAVNQHANPPAAGARNGSGRCTGQTRFRHGRRACIIRRICRICPAQAGGGRAGTAAKISASSSRNSWCSRVGT